MTILFIITIILALWLIIVHISLCKARARKNQDERLFQLLRKRTRQNMALRQELVKLSLDRDFLRCSISNLADNYGDIDIHQELHDILNQTKENNPYK